MVVMNRMTLVRTLRSLCISKVLTPLSQLLSLLAPRHVLHWKGIRITVAVSRPCSPHIQHLPTFSWLPFGLGCTCCLIHLKEADHTGSASVMRQSGWSCRFSLVSKVWGSEGAARINYMHLQHGLPNHRRAQSEEGVRRVEALMLGIRIVLLTVVIYNNRDQEMVLITWLNNEFHCTLFVVSTLHTISSQAVIEEYF